MPRSRLRPQPPTAVQDCSRAPTLQPRAMESCDSMRWPHPLTSMQPPARKTRRVALSLSGYCARPSTRTPALALHPRPNALHSRFQSPRPWLWCSHYDPDGPPMQTSRDAHYTNSLLCPRTPHVCGISSRSPSAPRRRPGASSILSVDSLPPSWIQADLTNDYRHPTAGS